MAQIYLNCYHFKNCPVGAMINGSKPALYYNDHLQPWDDGYAAMEEYPLYCPRPIDGLYIVGFFSGGMPK